MSVGTRSVWLGLDAATMDPAQPAPYGLVRDAAIAVSDGRIQWVGPRQGLPALFEAWARHDAGGVLVTPGLVDCHTHLVYAGDRAREFELRLQGASYEEIARAGGGIVSTVRATRGADEDALLAQSLPRLDALLAEGVTTIEVKSGYGLSLDAEARMLRAARRLGQARDVSVCTSFLGAHAVPPEMTGRTDDYVDEVLAMLPALHAEGLVDAVDAFCERIAFSAAQTRRVFEAARGLGLPVKLHAEQLSDSGGAALAAEFGAISADHLEWLSESGAQALARAGTVAVMLPTAFYFLRDTQLPPIDLLRRCRVPMAVATDCNPGSSPCSSILLALNMACTLFRMTPEEALAGATRHAARALGLADRGMLAPGLRADMALWAVREPAQLCYAMGARPGVGAVCEGRVR